MHLENYDLSATLFIPTVFETVRQVYPLGNLSAVNSGTSYDIARVVGDQRIILVTGAGGADSSNVTSFFLKGGTNRSVPAPIVVSEKVPGGSTYVSTLKYDRSVDFWLDGPASPPAATVVQLPPPLNLKDVRVNVFQITTPDGLVFRFRASPFASVPSTIQLVSGTATTVPLVYVETRRAEEQQKGVGTTFESPALVRETDTATISASASPTAIPSFRGVQLISVAYPPTGAGEHFEIELQSGMSGTYAGLVSGLGNVQLKSTFRCSARDIGVISPDGRVIHDGTLSITDLSGRTWTLIVKPTYADTGRVPATLQLSSTSPSYSGLVKVEATRLDFF